CVSPSRVARHGYTVREWLPGGSHGVRAQPCHRRKFPLQWVSGPNPVSLRIEAAPFVGRDEPDGVRTHQCPRHWVGCDRRHRGHAGTYIPLEPVAPGRACPARNTSTARTKKFTAIG